MTLAREPGSFTMTPRLIWSREHAESGAKILVQVLNPGFWVNWRPYASSDSYHTVAVIPGGSPADKERALADAATALAAGPPDGINPRKYQAKRSANETIDGRRRNRDTKERRASKLLKIAEKHGVNSPEYAAAKADLKLGKIADAAAAVAESSQPFVELATAIMHPATPKATGPVWPQAGALLHDDNVEAFLALEGPRAPGDEAAALYLYVQHYASRSKEFAVFSGESRADGSWAREENLMRISGASGLPSQEVAIAKMRELAKKGADHWRRDLHGQSIPDKPVF